MTGVAGSGKSSLVLDTIAVLPRQGNCGMPAVVCPANLMSELDEATPLK
ncbi:MAG: hypothetical protein II950_00605 [Prevotella sp.]|nr:hypothetical protein [Prevotella sp.]